MPPRSRKPSDEPGAALSPGAPPESPPESAVGTASPPDSGPPAEVPAPRPDLEATRAAVAAGDGMVRALLVEREGLVRAKKSARIGQVDEQLRLRGYPVDPSEGTQ